MGIVDHSMSLIAQAALEAGVPHQSRIRIGRTAELAIGVGVLANSRTAAAAISRWRILVRVVFIELLDLLFSGLLDGLERLLRQGLN